MLARRWRILAARLGEAAAETRESAGAGGALTAAVGLFGGMAPAKPRKKFLCCGPPVGRQDAGVRSRDVRLKAEAMVAEQRHKETLAAVRRSKPQLCDYYARLIFASEKYLGYPSAWQAAAELEAKHRKFAMLARVDVSVRRHAPKAPSLPLRPFLLLSLSLCAACILIRL